VSHGVPEPEIRRQPEVIHGVRNLVQNAVDFARSTVWLDLEWDSDSITLRVVDDGPGYPLTMIGRMGEPFVGTRRRAADADQRPEYEGMGLGLFISRTLLERTGAQVNFANARDPFEDPGKPGDRIGAIVEVVWPRRRLELGPDGSRRPLGENPRIRI